MVIAAPVLLALALGLTSAPTVTIHHKMKDCSDRMRAMRPPTPDQDDRYRATYLKCMGLPTQVRAPMMVQPHFMDKASRLGVVAGPAPPPPTHP